MERDITAAVANARHLLLLDGGTGPVLVEDWCRLGPSVARGLLAASEEVERLRAELAEALATLDNERGGGKPPEVGWVWDAHLRQWTYYDNVKPRSFVVRAAEDRWAWGTWGPKGRRGLARTARAAMRAAAKAMRGEP